MLKVKGNIVDVLNKKIFFGALTIANQQIIHIEKLNEEQPSEQYILPGLIDSHIHIESSMLVPSEFAKMAVLHGTVATISDPHEIANVCGIEGVEYMIENGKTTPFKFYFGAPSCVPATQFETAGATISVSDIDYLLQKDEVCYLSEMMNFPGVLFKNEEVMQKIDLAKRYNKPVDGHAPGLRGKDAKQYIDAGISTDHECYTYDEALEKLKYGMKILIREGSAAKNFEALIDLLHDYEDEIMFCSDDKHPDSLELNHINEICRRAVAKGIDVYKVLKAACVNPVRHYNLEVGLLQINDPADFIVCNNLQEFKVHQTYINGELVADNGKSLFTTSTAGIINQFNIDPIDVEDLKVTLDNYPHQDHKIPLIKVLDGQLITETVWDKPTIQNNELVSNIEVDCLKIVVVNRYQRAPIAKAFITQFGLKSGAIASSVAHDSHNIVAVGVDDESIARAVNLIIQAKGGISCVSETQQMVIDLPVAGLMSTADGYTLSKAYTAIDRMAKSLGCTLNSPFMSLSFMALLVIPEIKLSDKGLFNGKTFQFYK